MKNILGKIKEFFKKDKKIAIAIVILVVVILVNVIGYFVIDSNKDTKKLKKSEGKVAITEEGIIKSETYNGLTFDNITLIKENGIYTLTVDVKNTSNEAISIEKVYIPIKNKKGNTIISLLGYIGDTLEPNEVRTITASTNTDLRDAYTKEITEQE